MNTLFAILKVTDARRDVILAGGLNHWFAWRHHPPPPPNPTWSMMNFMCRTCSLCYPWEFSLRMYSTDSNKSNLMNYRWAIPKTIPGNFISISMLCSTFARHLVAAVAAYLINVTRLRQHCSSWLLVFTRRFWLFCLLHMDHRWKQSCDWRSHRTANVAWTPSKK